VLEEEEALANTHQENPHQENRRPSPPEKASDPDSESEDQLIVPERGPKPKLSKKAKKRQQAAAQFRRGHRQFPEPEDGAPEEMESTVSEASDLEGSEEVWESIEPDRARGKAGGSGGLEAAVDTENESRAGGGEAQGEADGSEADGESSTESGDDEGGEDGNWGPGVEGGDDEGREKDKGGSSEGEDDMLAGLLKLQKERRKTGGGEVKEHRDCGGSRSAGSLERDGVDDGGLEAVTEAAVELSMEEDVQGQSDLLAGGQDLPSYPQILLTHDWLTGLLWAFYPEHFFLLNYLG
jgi:hypothetical protein